MKHTTKEIRKKLQIIKKIQNLCEHSHVGGSLGLYIQGKDVLRNLDNSDIDIILHDSSSLEYFKNNKKSKKTNVYSKGFVLSVILNTSKQKVEFCVNPNMSYDTIEFEGSVYRVSKVEDILKFKKSYAKKGAYKHIQDLFCITYGFNPFEK